MYLRRTSFRIICEIMGNRPQLHIELSLQSYLFTIDWNLSNSEVTSRAKGRLFQKFAYCWYIQIDFLLIP